MTVRMNNNFINYTDFIDVSVEALNTAPRELFEKIMRMIITSLHTQTVEIEKQSLEIDEMNIIPVNNLDEFYDTVIDAIEDTKLFKKKLKTLKEKDTLFNELYKELDRLLTAYINHIDRMGQLEIRILTQAKSA